MPGHASNIQAVFLVDVSTYRHHGNKWDEAISLSIFRILNFLNSQLQSVDKTKTKHLRWGYKLFDIEEKLTNIDSRASGFQDFKLKSFQEFEKVLKKCVPADSTSSVQLARSETDQTTKKRLLVSTHPSLCLSKRLNETMHDFPWEMPDIGSPIKGRKETGQSDSSEHSNYVFLLCCVPCDKKSLRQFCNQVVMDKTVFLEAIIPKLLKKEFCDHRKIQLHWIDTGRYAADDSDMSADKKSYELVKQSLKMIGTLLVPFHSLITHLASKHLVTSQGTERRVGDDGEGMGGDTQRKREKEGDARMEKGAGDDGEGREREKGGGDGDPVTVLLSSFACTSICTAMVSSSSHRNYSMSRKVLGHEASASATLSFGDQGGAECTHVALKMVPVTKNAAKTKRCAPNSGQSQEMIVTTEDNTDNACILLTPANTPGRPSPHSQLQVRGCMDKGQVRQLGSRMGRPFLCMPEETVVCDQRKAFSALLQAIHSRQQALVLTVKIDADTAPYLALLEACSSTTAYLTYLSLGLTLQVEKLLSLTDCVGQSSGHSHSRSLDDFKDWASKVIASNSQRSQNAEDHGTRETTNRQTGRLWAGVMNPWHSTGSVPSLQSHLDSLTDRLGNTCPMSIREQLTLRSLKHAYRQENQPPFLLHPSQQSTPRLPPSPFLSLSSAVSSGESNISRDNLADRRRGSVQESGVKRERPAETKTQTVADITRGQDGTDNVELMPQTLPTPLLKLTDLKTEEDLEHFTQQQYQTALQSGGDVYYEVHTVVSACLHFFTSQQHPCPQKRTAEFLGEKILKTFQQLKSGSSQSNPDQKTDEHRELKVQVCVRLEIEFICSTLEDRDPSLTQQTCDQIVEMLRFLFFTSGNKAVLHFLNTAVLPNYQTTLADLLVNVYDDLMLALPRELRHHRSQSQSAATSGQSSGQSSPFAFTDDDDDDDDDGSQDPAMSMPSSQQSASSPTRLTRNKARFSLPAIDSKRQITVHLPAPKTTKGGKSKKGPKDKTKKEKSKSPAKHKGGKKARRNLFDTELGGASTSKEARQPSKSSRKKKLVSPSTHPRSKELVAETPHHRLKGAASRRVPSVSSASVSGGADEVQVVQESPYKDVSSDSVKTTPGRYKAPQRVLRRSFYSTGILRNSRSLSRAMENPATISGRHHVAHLQEVQGARLAEALSGDRTSSQRRQITALLNPQTGASPTLQSPAYHTRSKTPQREARRPLLEDSSSMPAFPSAAKILDFTSPKKQSTFTRSNILDFTSPKKQPGLTRSKTLVSLPSATVTSQTMSSQGGDDFDVVCETPTKVAPDFPVTPTKYRTRAVSPVEDQSSPKRKVPWSDRSTEQDKSGLSTLTKYRSRMASPAKAQSNPKRRVPWSDRSTERDESGLSTPTKHKSRVGSPAQLQSSPRKRVVTTAYTEQSALSTPTKYRARSRGRSPAKAQSCSGVTATEMDQTNVSTPTKNKTRGRVGSPTKDQSSPKRKAPWRDMSTERESGVCTPTKLRTRSSTTSPDKTNTSPVRGAGDRSRRTEREKANLSTSTKPGLPTREGMRCGKGVSPQGCSSSSSSSQSSILDYVSPSRSARSGAGNVRTGRLVSSEADSSRSLATPTKSRQLLLSPLRSPSCSKINSSPAFIQQFMSPVKTPTKPILKPSPLLRRSDSISNRTPQKSPRVTFSVDPRSRGRTPSPPGDEGLLRSPDSMTKWQRRKRRWSEDNKPSSVSGEEARSCETSQRQAIEQDGSSQPFSVDVSSNSNLLHPMSSPCKKARSETKMSTISRPALFSENAMDSYFSASNDNVFLGASSSSSHTPTPSSPQFKAASSRTSFVSQNSSGFDLAVTKSSVDSLGGSQGFEIISDKYSEPSSPVFNTSPARRSHNRKRRRDDPCVESTNCAERKTHSNLSSSHNNPAPSHDNSSSSHKFHPSSHKNPPSVHQSAGKQLTIPPPSLTPSLSPSRSNTKLSPLRVKGEVTERKYSPSVSTTSLALLMSSPLLVKPTQRTASAFLNQSQTDSVRSPVKKRSRKKLEML